MARRSGRLSIVATETSTGVAGSGRKRAQSSASDRDTPAKPTKQKRGPTAPETDSKTSRYFSQSHAKSEAQIDSDKDSTELSASANESDFASVQDIESSVASDDEDEDSVSSEDNASKRRRKKPTSASKRVSTSSSGLPSRGKGNELWREATKLEPGTEVIIKKPKARPAGKTPYKDDTIHSNTLLFLQDLKENHDREWLKREWS